METIYTFLDNLFKGLPQSRALKKAKDELYQMMIEKYLDYKEEGKTENQAVGLVISEFGHIDDILEKMGIELDPNKKSSFVISENEAKAFIQSKSKHSTHISLGVFICIIAVGLLILLEVILTTAFPNLTSFQINIIAMLMFIMMIFSAVGLFMHAGSHLSKKSKIFLNPFELSHEAEHYIDHKFHEYLKTYHHGLLFGILMIMSSIIPFVLSLLIGPIAVYMVFLGFVMIGMGVFILIKVGMIHGGYSQLLKIGDYQPTKKVHDRFTNMVAFILFPLTAIVYFSWSFLSDAWTISWILWPIIGICFGIFASIMDYIHNKKN